MNTRILRMCDRTPISKYKIWRVRDLGQMQPLLFSIEHGAVTMRIEGAINDRCVWWRLPLARHREQARELFAELESCQVRGLPAAAKRAWLKGIDSGFYRE